jgi:methionyl-tRNA synthetase
MPRFCGDLLERLGRSPPAWMNSPLKSWKNDALTWTDGFDPFDGRPLAIQGKPPQIARLEAKQLERLIVVTPDEPQKVSVAASPAETASKASAKPAAPAVPGVIGYDDFARVELRVARILEAEAVPKADKLLKISVDVGEGSPRTIVAGIAKAYPDPAALLGKHIVVVANLEPRPLRGITSQGMLLAAGEAPNLQVVTVGEAIAPGTRVK